MELEREEKSVVIDIERSDGQHFVMGTGTGWKLPDDSIEEWNSLDYAITSRENVLADGSRELGSRVNEKERYIEGAQYWGSNGVAERQRAITFFNPKYTFRVHITYHGRTRWCAGSQSGFKASTHNIYDKPVITWSIRCFDPYMRDENDHDKSFGDEIPYFGFPYVDLADTPSAPLDYPAGAIASIAVFDGVNTIYNQGDVVTPYKVVIKAKAHIVNPMISKDGKFVKVITDMKAGDELVIDLDAKMQKVTINGENAVQKTSRDSVFDGMEMVPGANRFQFACDNEENVSLVDVKVLFNDSYLGV